MASAPSALTPRRDSPAARPARSLTRTVQWRLPVRIPSSTFRPHELRSSRLHTRRRAIPTHRRRQRRPAEALRQRRGRSRRQARYPRKALARGASPSRSRQPSQVQTMPSLPRIGRRSTRLPGPAKSRRYPTNAAKVPSAGADCAPRTGLRPPSRRRRLLARLQLCVRKCWAAPRGPSPCESFHLASPVRPRGACSTPDS